MFGGTFYVARPVADMNWRRAGGNAAQFSLILAMILRVIDLLCRRLHDLMP